MSITLKAGSRLFASSSTTEMIAVRAPAGEVDLTIGGHPALTDVAGRDLSVEVVAGHDGGASMGKRYVDESGTVELLCTKAGAGVPAVGGALLILKDAKPLPASD